MLINVTAIAIMLGFWSSLYLLDVFLKQNDRFSRPYFTFLTKSGLTVSVMQLRWYTTTLNRFFIRIGSVWGHFWHIWFTVGVWVSVVLLVLAVGLLTLLVYNTLIEKHVEQQVLTPIMPGVNLPTNQLGYYLLTLLVCSILHEMGHAVAAVRERVRVDGFGVFAMLAYPGAYVNLHTDHLQAVSPMRQLRIYCAGVWHNTVIALLALAAISCLPWILSVGFQHGRGVVVTGVAPGSAVGGARGLVAGDVLRGVEGCPIYTVNDWRHCLLSSLRQPARGYCLTTDTVDTQDISIGVYKLGSGLVDCCNGTSATHLCFQYHKRRSKDWHYACLPARSTVEQRSCVLHSDCVGGKADTVCVTPVLNNSTRLLRVYHPPRPPLLFLGYPHDMLYTVALSNYIPRWQLLSIHLPYIIDTFCKYLVSLSGALALLNVVPCYALDGQFILSALVELLFRPLSLGTRKAIFTAGLLAGSVLLATNVALAMRSLVLS